VNFCRREQGILTAKGNPKGIREIRDLAKNGIRIVNRPEGTGTRLLIDGEIKKAGMNKDEIDGYNTIVEKHLDLGIEILSGRADAGPGIKAVAGLLGLDFIPLRWERFDLIMPKDRFFDKGIQLFLGLLRNQSFKDLAHNLSGYDINLTGEMVYPQDQ
jgi:molybdate-binding protein